MKDTIELLNQYYDQCAKCHCFLQGTCRYPWRQVNSHFFFMFRDGDGDPSENCRVSVLDDNRFRKEGCDKQWSGAHLLNVLRHRLAWKDFYKADLNPRFFLAALRKFSDKINSTGVYGANQELPFYFTRVSREGLGLCLSFLDFHYLHHGDNILEMIQDAFPEYTRDNGLFKIHPVEISATAISRANVVTSKIYYKNPGILPFDFKTGTVAINKDSNVIPIPLSSTRYSVHSLFEVSLLDVKLVLPEAAFKELALEKLDWAVNEINNVFSPSYQNEMEGVLGSLGLLDGKYSEEELRERIDSFIDIENRFGSYDFGHLGKVILDLCLYDRSASSWLPLTVFHALNVEEMKNMRMLFFDPDERINAEKRVLFKVIRNFYWARLSDLMRIWNDCRKQYPYDRFVSKNEWETAFTNALMDSVDSFPLSHAMTPVSYFADVVSAQQELRTCLLGALILTQTRLDSYYNERTMLYGDVYDSEVAKMFNIELPTIQYFTSMPDLNFVRKDLSEPEFITTTAVPTEDFRKKAEDFLPTFWPDRKEQRDESVEQFYTEEDLGGSPEKTDEAAPKKPFVFPKVLEVVKSYFVALKDAGYLDDEYRWLKNVPGHKTCQAGWASRIIVGLQKTGVTHGEIGKLLGYANIGNLANKNSTFENKTIEEIFTKAGLSIHP